MAKMGNNFMPFVAMTIVQLGFAGGAIVSKLVLDAGMNPFILSAYRPIFAFISIAPLAYFIERKNRPRMTPSIFFQIFLCATIGITGNQYAYFFGLKNSTPTVVGAIDNLIPAFTFLIAVPLGLEKLRLKSMAGQVKIVGTVVCVGGALLLSLYHGKVVIGQLGFHWKYVETTTKNINSAHHSFFTGPFLVILASFFYALWLIVQAKLNEKYPAPYTSISLMCVMATVECVIVGFCVVPNTSEWKLSPIRAFAAVYNAVVCTSMIFFLSSWCIDRKGPVYVSMYSPLTLVISAFLSWALFREKLYVGVVVGSILTVVGLYIFIWGQKKEMEENAEDLEGKDVKKENAHSNKRDLELQLPQNSDLDAHPSEVKLELPKCQP